MILLIRAVNIFAQIIIYMLIARAVCSWFIRPGGTAYRIYQALITLTEPVVAPCRRITSRFRTGAFDFSVLLAFFLVFIIRDLLIRLLFLFI